MNHIIWSNAHRSRRERPFDERHNKRSQTAIDVKSNIMFLREFRETGDIIHISVGEIRSRTDELKKEAAINVPRVARGLILSTDHDCIRVSFGNQRVRNIDVTDCEERLTWLSLPLARSTWRVIGFTGIV
jgi:hypothetical protein